MSFQTVSIIVLLLVNIITPLAFTIQSQNIVILKPFSSQYLTFIAAALWLLSCLENGKLRIRKTPANIIVLIYFLYNILSTYLAWNNFYFYAVEELARKACHVLLFFLIVQNFTKRKHITIFYYICAFVALLATVYGHMQEFDIDFIKWGMSVYVSTFGNKNFFAGYLIIMAPTIIGFGLSRKYWEEKIPLIILGLLMFRCIFVSRTRSGMMASLAFIALFIFFQFAFGYFRKYLQKINIVYKLFIPTIAAVITLALIYLIFPGKIEKQIKSVFNVTTGTNRVRIVMWTGFTRAAIDKPFLGHGLGTFQLVFPNTRPEYYHRKGVSHNTRHSHDEYFEVLGETGILGLALFFAVIISMFYLFYKRIITTKDNRYKQLLIGVMLGILCSLVQNTVSVNLRWASTAVTFWAILGSLAALIFIDEESDLNQEDKEEKAEKKHINLVIKIIVYLIVISILSGLLYAYVTLYKADGLLKKGMYIIDSAGNRPGTDPIWKTAEKNLLESLKYDRYELSTYYKYGYVLLNQNRMSEALATYNKLTELAPNYAQVHNNIGLLFYNIFAQCNPGRDKDGKKYQEILKKYMKKYNIYSQRVFKYKIENTLQDLIRIQFTTPYEAILQFYWATILENNERNNLHVAKVLTDNKLFSRAIARVKLIPDLVREEDWLFKKTSMVVALLKKNYKNYNKFYNELKQIENQYEQAYSFAGMLYNNLGDKKYALYYLRKAVYFNPLDYRAMYNYTQLFDDVYKDRPDVIEKEKKKIYLKYINKLTTNDLQNNQQLQGLTQTIINESYNWIHKNPQDREGNLILGIAFLKASSSKKQLRNNASYYLKQVLKSYPEDLAARYYLNILSQQK